MTEPSHYPGAPRWVKVFGAIAIILALLFAIVKIAGVGGQHGPGRHFPAGDAGGDTPPVGSSE